MGKPMDDEEAADFYADPGNPGFDQERVIRRPLADSIPVRFPPGMVERVRTVAASEGATVSEWVRQAVTEALTRYDQPQDRATIARELERLARKLRRSA